MKSSSHQSGSALLATLMIAGSIGLVLVSITRFTLLELRTTTSLEDSTLAYAAAEAGLEEGLLRWRFNRNSETPMNQAVTAVSPLVNQVNLTTGIQRTNVPLGDALTTITRAPTDSVYEVRTAYKDTEVGSDDPVDLGDPRYPYRLGKDQTLELDVSNLRGEELEIRYATVGGNRVRLETRIVHEDPVTHLFEEACATTTSCKQLWPDNLGSVGTTPLVIGSIPAGQDGLGYRVRIKPYIFQDQVPAAATSYIAYHIRPVGGSGLIDTGVTTIESIGYYGTAQRKLVAKLDRRSGTILGIYDYVLFSTGNLGQP